MDAKRYVIVNADDFGRSPGVNRGVIEAHERGIVTSASLMVRWPAAREAAACAREHPALSLGLHFDLGEWAYREGAWVRLYEVVPEDDGAAAADELGRQLAAFRALVGRGPTHMDSHQHIHRREPVRSLTVGVARRLGVPLRHCSPYIRYCGDFYGQTAQGSPHPEGIRVESLLRLLAELPPGITELACHPGEDSRLDTMYREERAQEVAALCDPQVRAAVAHLGIGLRSFRGIGAKEIG